jgi:hypothetical protein
VERRQNGDSLVPECVMSQRLLRIFLLLTVSLPASAIEPFFAPPVPQGEIEVRLHPTEDVDTGVPTLVTFGVPFPRGSITQAGLSSVRVLRNGVEIPAHVSEMTPWRHRSDVAIDGQSVRVARVQIQHAFAAGFPASEPVTLQWGGVARTLDVPVAVDPRSAWHLVTSGRFIAADGVSEPDVYAVLPRTWLVRGALKSSRSTPFDPTNTEPRDSPAANDAIAHWPEYTEAERAFKNNFYTATNRDDPLVLASNYAPYKTTREPWLYDRSATMFVLYFRSGFFTALREAVQAGQFYANLQNASGFFTLQGAAGDVKYAYNECLAYTFWTTGDPTMPAKIGLTASAVDGYPHAWTPQRNSWTERHAAFKLLAKVVGYEVLGGAARRDAVNLILSDLRAHQDGAAGQIPSPRVDGGLYHTGNQHDPDEMEDFLDDYLASSWMSVLLSDAVVRAYATGEDVASASFVARLADFLRSTVIQTTDHEYPTSEALARPRYSVRHDGSAALTLPNDTEHALEVAAHLAWGRYFRELLGANGNVLRDAAVDMYATYDEGVNEWIRPAGPASGLPAFRLQVGVYRKWGWEHRTSDGLAFALSELDPDAVFANGFEMP